MSSTAKLILIIVIIVAVVALLIAFIPKAGANPGNGGGNGNGGSGNGGNGNGGPTAGTKNYNTSTWKIGDLVYASNDIYAVCTDCILPNWLCLLNDCYSWNAGSIGNFAGVDGSTLKFTNDGYNYTVLLGDARPYTLN